jgi:hypothetical protein
MLDKMIQILIKAISFFPEEVICWQIIRTINIEK